MIIGNLTLLLENAFMALFRYRGWQGEALAERMQVDVFRLRFV